MNGKALLTITFFCAVMTATVRAAPVEITLPQETATLRESTLPGYQLAQQKCGICHSFDYISFQPPGMNLDQWTAEMKKMQHSYGAPINEQEIKSIAAYLAVTYGSAKASDPAVIAASVSPSSPNTATAAAAIDVDELLNANACLGCHAIDIKVVGPSFRDIATKYTGQADAESELSVSIKNGGVGKWGQMPMPPMASLSDEQAKALTKYILGL
ncbi:MAG: cytochrome c551/c552 [Halioglobus sp.]|jgi:cytochrome c551/c552